MAHRKGHSLLLNDDTRLYYALKQREGKPFYFVTFRSPEGKRLERSTKEVSQKRALDSAVRIIKAVYTAHSNAGQAIAWDLTIELLKQRMAANNNHESTIDDYLMILGILRKVFPYSQNPSDITDEMARRFKAIRASQVKPRTLHGNLNKLSVLWSKWLIDECGLVTQNPWLSVSKPKLDKPSPRYLEEGEQASFFQWLDDRWDRWRLPTLLFRVKGLIGCRLLELCSLPTAHLQEGRILLSSETNKGRKTKRSKIPTELFEELIALTGETYVWESYSEQLRAIHQRRGLSRQADNVKPFAPKRLKRFLQKEITAYNQAHSEVPGFRPFTAHTFRGTAMSKAVQAGASVDQASIAFGCHPETMRTHYLALQEQDIADAVLDRIQGESVNNT